MEQIAIVERGHVMKTYSEIAKGDIQRQADQDAVIKRVREARQVRAEMNGITYEEQEHNELFYSPELGRLVKPWGSK